MKAVQTREVRWVVPGRGERRQRVGMTDWEQAFHLVNRILCALVRRWDMDPARGVDVRTKMLISAVELRTADDYELEIDRTAIKGVLVGLVRKDSDGEGE